jgi:hypothetical protein
LTILNPFASDYRTSKYMRQKLTKLKEEMGITTIIGDLSRHLSKT